MPPAFPTVREFCLRILMSGDLQAKLQPPLGADGGPLDDSQPGPALKLDQPARDDDLRPVRGLPPLPPRGQVDAAGARVACVSRFAHHELMAVELFAWALLTWPELPPRLRRGLLATLADEQRHLRMYLGRLQRLGAGLGRAPLSDYLWRHAPAMREHPAGPAAFLAAMGLTFEQANLDFTLAYRDGFRDAGDVETADVLARVHQDEIGHVRLAWRWLRRLEQGRRGPQEAVEVYRHAVPFPLGPTRARGRPFDRHSRRRAGLPESLIEFVRRARPGLEEPGRAPAVADGTLLLCNIGADSEEMPRSAGARAAAGRLARLWALSFGRCARLLGPEGQVAARRWPAELGPAEDGPVWPWLTRLGPGIAWMPTEEAHRRLLAAGCRRPPRPHDPRVGDKGWLLRRALAAGLLGEHLAPLIQVLEPHDLRRPAAAENVRQRLAAWPPWTAGEGVLKPRHGGSGRGRVRVSAAGPPPTSRALDRLARLGGAVLEPWLPRLEDFSMQARVAPGGEIRLLGATRVLTSPAGLWLGNAGVLTETGESGLGVAARELKALQAILGETARRVGPWLARRGHTGPYGLDAFTWRAPDGGATLRPFVEVNPRFTAGTVALGLVERARRAGLTDGRPAWALLASRPHEAQPHAGVRLLDLGEPGDPRPATLVLAADAGRRDRLLHDWLGGSAAGAIGVGQAPPPPTPE